jgi:putative endonuclease
MFSAGRLISNITRCRRRAIRWLSAQRHCISAHFRGLVESVVLALHYGDTGAWGETIAEKFIRRSRCIILARNWRSKRLEADIIALDGRTVTVIEVKTRHENLRGLHPAHEAVTREKEAHLDSLASAFKRSYGPLCRRLAVRAFRFDTIEVYYTKTAFGRRRATEIMWHRR